MKGHDLSRREFLKVTAAAGALAWGGFGTTAMAAGRSCLRVAGLHVQDAPKPLGIDAVKPRLGWRLESERRGECQSAYQVLVASSALRLTQGKADLWDSGEVTSAQTLNIVYAGAALQPERRYYWRVRVWDADGRASRWSEPARWEMGLPKAKDWHADWIWLDPKDARHHTNPLFRREFTLDAAPQRARAYICGLGYYELFLNGKRVGDHVLDPAWTDYSQRAFYVTYDVTDQLVRGRNVIGVALGRGWFAGLIEGRMGPADPVPSTGTAWDSRLRLLFRLVAEDAHGRKTVLGSDKAWRATSGPSSASATTPDTEHYDARLEQSGWLTPRFDDSGWASASILKPARVEIQAQPLEPIKITNQLAPVGITQPQPGVFVFDFGRNIAGVARLRVRGPAATKVTLRHGERLRDDGCVHAGGRDQLDTYILRGKGTEVWQPQFTYKGFQFVELRGYPGTPTRDALTALRLHSSVPSIGEFSCANALLNRIHEATRSTILNNHVSVPTDGSMEEKLPWTGDAGLMEDCAFMNFDMRRFYTKWLHDIRDGQDEQGNIGSWMPQPHPGFRPPSPAWAHQYVATVWNLRRYYDAEWVGAEFYESLARYAAFEMKRLDDRGLSADEWGDYIPHFPQSRADNALMGSAFVQRTLARLADIAAVLGKEKDARCYQADAEAVVRSFNAAYFSTKRGFYRSEQGGPFRQTPNVLALAFGFVPPERVNEVVRSLVEDVEITHNAHLKTGVLGTKYLLPVLCDHGHVNLAFRVATQTTEPSWGYWFANGATSLWEMWHTGTRSRGHGFLGTVDEWFYQYLAGIRPTAPGFRRFTVKPHLPDDLDHAGASMDTVRGRVAAYWKRERGRVTLQVGVPVGTTAEIHVPGGGKVSERGRPADSASGIRPLGHGKGFTRFEVGSGHYCFHASD